VSDKAAVEGDDIEDDLPDVFSELPLRAIQFGSDFIALDALAEERRAAVAKGGPEGAILPPLGTFRRMIDARGYGDCLCRSYLAAMKEGH
jgi:hypothetical protein